METPISQKPPRKDRDSISSRNASVEQKGNPVTTDLHQSPGQESSSPAIPLIRRSSEPNSTGNEGFVSQAEVGFARDSQDTNPQDYQVLPDRPAQDTTANMLASTSPKPIQSPRSRSKSPMRRDVERKTFENKTGSYTFTRSRGSKVTSVVQTSPRDEFTDPMLLRFGIRAHASLLGTEGEDEEYFKNFRKRESPRSFFQVGRVFRILWVEEASTQDQSVTTVLASHAEKDLRVFSRVREFVVVKEAQTYCTALPIVTYGRKGVSRSDLIKFNHGMIYTGNQTPDPLPGEALKPNERPMRPAAIRVIPDDPKHKLDVASRVDYGRVFTIQHTLKVQNFGRVQAKHTRDLLRQFREVWTDSEMKGVGLNAVSVKDPYEEKPTVKVGGQRIPNAIEIQQPKTNSLKDDASGRSTPDLVRSGDSHTQPGQRAEFDGAKLPVAQAAEQDALSEQLFLFEAEESLAQSAMQGTANERPLSLEANGFAAGSTDQDALSEGLFSFEDQNRGMASRPDSLPYTALQGMDYVTGMNADRGLDIRPEQVEVPFSPSSEPAEMPRQKQRELSPSTDSSSKPIEQGVTASGVGKAKDLSWAFLPVTDIHDTSLDPTESLKLPAPPTLHENISDVRSVENELSFENVPPVGGELFSGATSTSSLGQKQLPSSDQAPRMGSEGAASGPNDTDIFETALSQHSQDALIPPAPEQARTENVDMPPWLIPPNQGEIKYEVQAGAFAKQLRRLRRRVDIVLQKRTEWRYDVQKLDYNRQYLHETLKSLITALNDQQLADLPTVSPKLPNKRKKKAPRSARATSDSVENAEGLEKVEQLERSSSESGSYMQGPIESKDKELIDDAKKMTVSRSDVSSLLTQYMTDYENAVRVEEKIKNAMRDLNDHEFRLESLLKGIGDMMQSANFAEQLSNEMLNDPLPTDDDASSHVASEQSLPELVAEYFSRAGDINVYTERLHELDHTYDEERADREYLLDRADPGSDVEEWKHHNQYYAERRRIEKILKDAKEAAAELEQHCKLAGFDPALYRNVAPSSHGGSIHHDGPDPLPPLEDPGKASSDIHSWLNSIDAVGLPSNSPIPPVLEANPFVSEKSPSLEVPPVLHG